MGRPAAHAVIARDFLKLSQAVADLGHVVDIEGEDELRAVAEMLPGFRAATVVWQPQPQWTGATGTPVDLAAAEASTLAEWPDVYVCGPPPMIDAAYAALTAAGVPREQIHAERFLSAAAP